MKAIIIAQAAVSLLVFLCFCIFLLELFRYRKLRHIFSADYLKEYKLKRLRSYKLLIPQAGSKKYKSLSLLIERAGWNITVEQFSLYKAALLLIGILGIISIQTTNQQQRSSQILNNLNYNKIMTERFMEVTPEAVQLEQELYKLLDGKVKKSKDLYKASNMQLYTEYIQQMIQSSGYAVEEQIDIVSKRMLEKLKAIRAIDNQWDIYLAGLLISILLYMLPDIMALIKIKLIEDKKDWEALNCIFTFAIFGRLPPYSVLQVLENMAMVTEAYRPLINKLIEGIKRGAGASIFDDIDDKTDNEELKELFETMKLASVTGLLNAVDDIDELAEQKLKWMEIKGIKRRKLKRLYAMTLVAIVFLVAGIYFSYGLTILSNPAYLFPKT